MGIMLLGRFLGIADLRLFDVSLSPRRSAEQECTFVFSSVRAEPALAHGLRVITVWWKAPKDKVCE